MQPTQPFVLLTATITAALGAQNHVVAPASATTTDAMSYEWIAGASQPLRQQTLVGQSHLQSMIGSGIQAIELRRHAAAEVYQGGAMTLTVTLSTSPNTPVNCDNYWIGNVGNDAMQVFSGTVTLPTSPATVAGTGTPVAWTSNNTLRVAFQQPFPYGGGTLCVDVVGQPIAGQEANWWMADADEEVIAGGSAVEIGGGCGIYGGPQSRWSQVAVRSLVPGGRAQFRAEGVPNGFAMAAFGGAATSPIPLSVFGINSPGCFSHLDPNAILAMVPATYVPEVHPASPVSAIAEVLVRLPAHPSWFGAQLTTQWFDFTQLATSNAHTWTVANAIPTLDMALNEGHPLEAKGHVTTYLAHVMRFEYQ